MVKIGREVVLRTLRLDGVCMAFFRSENESRMNRIRRGLFVGASKRYRRGVCRIVVFAKPRDSIPITFLRTTQSFESSISHALFPA